MSELTHVTSPHDPSARVPLSALFTSWEDAGTRTLLAQHRVGNGPVDPADLLTRLALGERLAQEITCGRWVTVAEALRVGSGWADIARALGMDVDRAREDFGWWIAGQVELYRATGLGLSPAEAADLRALAEGVAR